MKKTIFLLLLGSVVLFFSQCEEDENNADWATNVAGTYTGTAFHFGFVDPAVTTLSRVNDTLLRLQLIAGTDTFCIDSVRKHSETTMEWLEHDACFDKVTGGIGIFGGDSLGYNFESADSFSSVVFNGKK